MPVLDSEGAVTGLFIDNPAISSADMDNTVVIMAGGMGMRLRPLTETMPKPMIPVAGKPMMQHTIEALRSEGFRRFVLSVNYLGEQIEDYFGDGTEFGIEVSYLREQKPLGTGGALSLLTGSFSSPLVVVNGDVLFSASMTEMLDYHISQSAEITVGIKLLHTQIPFGVVEVDGPKVIGLREKPVYRDFVNAGVYILEPTALTAIPKDVRHDMTDLLATLIKRGSASGFPLHESWIDLGRPEDLIRAEQEYVE
jgi:NDP-sugar pyrophosphorylase family protein